MTQAPTTAARPCTKRVYPSEAAALKARRQHKGLGKKLRAYRCNYANHWHLTTEVYGR